MRPPLSPPCCALRSPASHTTRALPAAGRSMPHTPGGSKERRARAFLSSAHTKCVGAALGCCSQQSGRQKELFAGRRGPRAVLVGRERAWRAAPLSSKLWTEERAHARCCRPDKTAQPRKIGPTLPRQKNATHTQFFTCVVRSLEPWFAAPRPCAACCAWPSARPRRRARLRLRMPPPPCSAAAASSPAA